MALNCEEKLSADILKDCDNIAFGGLEVNAVIINFDDIDKAASTLDGTNDLIITNLATKSGTSGFSLEGVKQTNGASFEFVIREDTTDAYKHLFAGVVLTPSADNKKRLDEMGSNGRYVVVVEKMWKGANQEDAFEVLGWDVGLELATMVWSSKEGNGAVKFELASVDTFEEPKMTRNNLETDYATTKTAFDAKYATA